MQKLGKSSEFYYWQKFSYKTSKIWATLYIILKFIYLFTRGLRKEPFRGLTFLRKSALTTPNISRLMRSRLVQFTSYTVK